jgi:hypothetical protein
MSTPTGTPGFAFTHDPLTPLDPHCDPTAEQVHQLRLELYTNARTVQTDLGNGAIGQLGVLMPDPEYIALTGAVYVPPERPDIPNYAGVLDRGEIQEMKELYLEETRIYNEARAFTNAIKKLMVAAIPNLHLGRLNNRLHGLANVTPQAILQHMLTAYGDIDEDARTLNLAQMNTPWDPSTPLNTVFLNADHCQSFAAEGGEPILDTTYVRTILKVLKNSGVFDEAVTHWRTKPPDQHTVANLIAHFTQFDKYRKADQPLKDALTALQAKFPTAEPPLQDALTALAAKTSTPHRPPTKAAPKPGPPIPSTGGSDLTTWKYCWSHGLGLGGHTSAECSRPFQGHCTEATLENRMGGVNTIKGKRGDPVPFKPPPRTPKSRG